MRKLFLLIGLFGIVKDAYGQDMTHNISSYQADSLTRLLARSFADNTSSIKNLLKLAEYNILKPGEKKTDLDSADLFIKRAELLNLKMRSVDADGAISLSKAGMYRESGQLKLGEAAAKAAVQLLKQTNDKYNLGLAYFELAQYDDANNSNQLADKVHLIELASDMFKQAGYVELTAYADKVLADLYNIEGESGRALQKIKSSLSAYQSIHYRYLQGVYGMLGAIYYRRADFMQALNYELAALKNANDVRDTSMQLCEINNYVGLILTKLNQDAKAVSYFKSALKIGEKHHDATNVILIIYNISNSYIHINQGNKALILIKNTSGEFINSKKIAIIYLLPMTYLNIYSSLHNFEAAKLYSNKLIHIANLSVTSGQDKNNIYFALCKYFITAKKYALAHEYLLKNQKILAQINEPIKVTNNYRLWVKLDSSEKNYKDAFIHLLSYNKINDSIFQENKKRQIREITSFYETVRKQNEIRIRDQSIKLLRQENQIQFVNLKQANVIKTVTISGLIVLIFILGLLYRQYLNKKKSNLETSEKNNLLQSLLTEKEWLLKEVHHRVRNNLHTVICLLESQAAYLENDALKAIENSQHRIYAMSLIHQKLYQAEDIKTIDMSAYLPEFVQYLKDYFSAGKNIHFKMNIEPIMLGISQAVPLALIVNEIVSNSMKHAFQDGMCGEIEISIVKIKNKVRLSIRDNGIGIKAIRAKDHASGLGLKLINGLSEDLEASLVIENDRGTRVRITFEAAPLDYTSGPLAHFEKYSE